MKTTLLLLSLNFIFQASEAQDSINRKIYQTHRIKTAPHIDGEGNEEVWNTAEIADGFRQSNPQEGGKISQRTEVRILYDDNAVYVLGTMYDTDPKEIRKELSLRDGNPNADAFKVVFDTYNSQQDAYIFQVTASNVQSDYRFSDQTYDAVWESAVKIGDSSWTVEMKIPYSAIRFPVKDEQEWGIQFARIIVRNNEYDQWSLTPKGSTIFKQMKFFGRLLGLNHIRKPLRLSVTPYITGIIQNDQTSLSANKTSYGLAGGLGIRYGINESFTLESTILPDFSQVQSDNKVKNLTPFETQYVEQRPFFKEGIELFNLGGLFYSRRIGQTLNDPNTLNTLLSPNEFLVKAPDASTLLNSTKISGRTNKGLGVGILNSIVDDTYATAQDSTGKSRKLISTPFTNYNIIVLDQHLQHSSDLFLINTNVARAHDGNQANVTALGLTLNDKKVNYGLTAIGAYSNIVSLNDTTKKHVVSTGYKYEVSFNKQSGNIQYSLGRRAFSPNFQINDLGINYTTNFVEHNGVLSYLILNPVGKILNGNFSLNVNEQQNFTTNEFMSLAMGVNANIFTRRFYNYFFLLSGNPAETKDYYEARTPGRIFIRPKTENSFINFSTDNNKKLALGFSVNFGKTPLISPTLGREIWYGLGIGGNYRVSNRLSFNFSSNISQDNNDRGWVDTPGNGTIVFGRRDVFNFTNVLGAGLVLTNKLSFTLHLRHYWELGNYISYFDLNQAGGLDSDPGYTVNQNFNVNIFNIDAGIIWWFAPGSSMSVVWKNAISTGESKLIYNYGADLNRMLEAPQLNTLSVKILYYFDFLYLRRHAKDTGTDL
jgi:hypothetical protein